MQAKDVQRTCPTCGAPAGDSAANDDTAVRVKVHPYVKEWFAAARYEVAERRHLLLKEPMAPIPDSDLLWATHFNGYIVVYRQLEQDRVEFIRITDGWQSFLDR